MAYSTIDDIRLLLPEAELVSLTDDEGLGVVNQLRIDEAIAQADAEIDSYCAVRYSVPIEPVPYLLKKLSVDMSVYNLYSRTVRKMPSVRTERYKQAIRLLESVAGGLVSLGVADAPEAADDKEGTGTNRTADENVFSRKRLEGF